MDANPENGKLLIEKYLGQTPQSAKRREHSLLVGNFSAKVAQRIKKINPELNLDVNLCEFLGYCHDLGYFIDPDRHELHTIDILKQEGVSVIIAQKTMHGQLLEQFGEKENKVLEYTPVDLEGIILTYCDMSIHIGIPITIDERAQEIIERVRAIPSMPENLKNDIVVNLQKALPRFKRYEKIVLALAALNSVKEF